MILRKFRGPWFLVVKIYFFIALLFLSAIKSGLFLTGFIIPLIFYVRGVAFSDTINSYKISCISIRSRMEKDKMLNRRAKVVPRKELGFKTG